MIGIEYVKSFKFSSIESSKVSFDEDYLGALSNSRLKIYDIQTLDLFNTLELEAGATCFEFCKAEEGFKTSVAVGVGKEVVIYDCDGSSGKGFKRVGVNRLDVRHLIYVGRFEMMMSVDEKLVEFWSTKTWEFPQKLKFRSKIESDFMSFAKEGCSILSYSLSRPNTHLLTFDSKHILRLFKLKQGRQVLSLDLSLESQKSLFGGALPSIELDRRVNNEKSSLPSFGFDETGQYFYHTSLSGI